MFVHVPRLVTIEVGASSTSLCAQEILSVVNETADLTVGTVRFVLAERDATDILLRAAEHAQYRGVDAIISLPHATEESIRGAAAISPAAIALPLQSHYEKRHDAIAPDRCLWRETVAFAAMARHHDIDVELETEVVPANAGDLISIASVAAAMHADRWRVDFSAVKPHTSTAATILGIAGRGMLPITVHALPQLRLALLQKMTAAFRVPDLRKLSSIDLFESVHIRPDGAVVVRGRTSEIAGSTRQQTIAGIFNGSAAYVRLRSHGVGQTPSPVSKSDRRGRPSPHPPQAIM